MNRNAIQEFRDRLKAFSFQRECIDIVEANKDKLADLQAAQWAQGLNSKGKRIYPEYSPFTVEQKKKKTGLAGVHQYVTYFDTGETYKKLYAAINGEKFSIKADTFKFDKIIKRSGVDTIGLNVDSRTDFVQEITKPGIIEAYNKKVLKI